MNTIMAGFRCILLLLALTVFLVAARPAKEENQEERRCGDVLCGENLKARAELAKFLLAKREPIVSEEEEEEGGHHEKRETESEEEEEGHHEKRETESEEEEEGHHQKLNILLKHWKHAFDISTLG